jgi:hypothetical protein
LTFLIFFQAEEDRDRLGVFLWPGPAHIQLLLSRDLRAFDSQKRVNEISLLIVFEVVIVFRHEVEKNSGPFFPCFFVFFRVSQQEVDALSHFAHFDQNTSWP